MKNVKKKNTELSITNARSAKPGYYLTSERGSVNLQYRDRGGRTWYVAQLNDDGKLRRIGCIAGEYAVQELSLDKSGRIRLGN